MTEPQTVASRLRARLKSIGEAADAHLQAHPAADQFAPVRRAWARLSRNDGLERLIPVGLCVLLAAAALGTLFGQLAARTERTLTRPAAAVA